MQTSSNSIPTDTQVNPLNFTNVSTLQDLNTHKSYVPIAGCVLEHILYNNQFSNIEKLNYILSDSIAPINYSRDAQRTSTLSAKQWGKILNCSKTKAFAAQKNLEEKGYFVIQRSTNKQGRNKNNIITPTLPNQVFAALSKTSEKWGSKVTSYTPSDKSKRAYLDRTKLFIPLNYQFLKLIASNNYLSSFAKVLLINFYCSWHKCHVATTNDNNKQDRLENNSSSNSFIISYEQLMTCFNCNKSTLSRAILMLQNLGFINKKRFFVRNDDKDDNRHDKSLWTISLLLPSSIQQELTKQKDRASSSSSYITKNRQYSLVKDSLDADSTPAIITEIAHTDPYVANSGQYYNKEEKINIKNIDSIDAKSHFLEKYENLQNCKFLSELSEFYKNSLEEEQKETLLEKEQKIVSITLPTINTQESFLEVEIYKEISSSVAKDKLESTKKVEEEQEEISETVREEQEKTLPLNQLREQSEEEQSNCAMGNSLVNTTSEIAVATASIVYHKKSSNQNKARTTTKFQGKSLKSFYPLTKEQVDKLNQLSSREFSNNFANQLLLKLYIRDPNKTFASTNHMIAYMSKAFRYEKHQAPLVNHETFRFTANVSDTESVEIRQKEKYLTEVEYSIDTSYSSQLRKKIAGMFETKLAYQILTEVKFDYHATKYQTTSQELEITNDAWQNLELSEENNITQFEHVLDDHSTCYVDSSLSLASKHDVANIDYDNQLSTNVTEENDQIKTSLVMTENDDINYNINDKIVTRELSELSLKSSLPARQLTRIILANTCTIKLPRDLALTNNQQQNLENAIVAVYGYVKIVYQQLPATYKKLSSSRLPDEIFLAELDQNSVWYKIRKKLIDNFDEHIDKAWFSKLRAEEDAITQKLTLIAPTNFLRDWINNKYGSVIKDIAKKLDYQFVELITKKQSLYNVV